MADRNDAGSRGEEDAPRDPRAGRDTDPVSDPDHGAPVGQDPDSGPVGQRGPDGGTVPLPAQISGMSRSAGVTAAHGTPAAAAPVPGTGGAGEPTGTPADVRHAGPYAPGGPGWRAPGWGAPTSGHDAHSTHDTHPTREAHSRHEAHDARPTYDTRVPPPTAHAMSGGYSYASTPPTYGPPRYTADTLAFGAAHFGGGWRGGLTETMRRRSVQLVAAGLLGAVVGGGAVAAVHGLWDRFGPRNPIMVTDGRPGPFGERGGPYAELIFPRYGVPEICERTDSGFRCEFRMDPGDPPGPPVRPSTAPTS
ncbi:hypothetical protein GCM10023259_051680 [Thermocatellispora tengchongensis]